MVLDSLIVGATLLGAVAYLAWRFFAKPRMKGACAACPSSARMRLGASEGQPKARHG
jgi:hypothetical protein